MVSLIKTSFIVLLNLIFFQFPGFYSTTFTITNNCTYKVWPAILSAAGTSPLPTTGFALQHGHSNTLAVPPAWSGRLWGRTLCSLDINGNFSCATGDCGTSTIECGGGNAAPPVTLVEFDFNGTGGLSLYDISLVDGFNLPVRVAPEGGNCRATGCVADLKEGCPTELKVIRDGEAVACKSTCETEPCLSSLFFKSACSRARVYGYDNHGIFTCSSPHYSITFCPNTKSRMRAGNKKEGSGKKVVKYTGVLVVLATISGFVIFRMRLVLSNRGWEISLSAGTRAESTIPTNA